MVAIRHAHHGDVRLEYQLHDRFRLWRPRLLLIQGVGFDADAWDPVVARLRRHFRLVVPDNRGTGNSDSSSSWYTVATMAGDVVAVLDAARIRTTHALGVSLGGMVAQELAMTHPHRVERLVLVSTTSGWPFSYPLPGPSGRLLATAPMLRRETALRRQVANMMSSDSIAARPHLMSRMSEYLRSRRHDPRVARRQMAAGAAYLGALRQRRIRAETLVLHGSADTVADPRNARLLAAQIPDARLVTFEGAGHLLFWEHPERFCEVVTDFLAPAAARP